MKLINEYGLNDLIKNTKTVIGVSAGSMNQGKRVVYKDDFENYVIKDYEGLGLTDINIFPHYELDHKEIVEEANEVSTISDILCLPNKSFIYIENDNMEVVGDYYELGNQKRLSK